MYEPADDINWYLLHGNDIDVELEIEKFNRAYAQKEDYIDIMDSVSEDYSVEKKAFSRLMESMAEISQNLEDVQAVIDSENTNQQLFDNKTTEYYNTIVDCCNNYMQEHMND